jgi:hypothetical protein
VFAPRDKRACGQEEADGTKTLFDANDHAIPFGHIIRRVSNNARRLCGQRAACLAEDWGYL